MRMHFGYVVGLLSSFQVYHQSMSNTLGMSPAEAEFSTGQLAAISTIFPVGEFFGTMGMALIAGRNPTLCNRLSLDWTAGLLILGALLTLVPGLLLLMAGRFLLGVGVGIGFVAAYIALFDCCRAEPLLPSSSLPSSSDRAVYLSAAFFFAGGTFLANAPMVLFPHTPEWVIRLLYGLPTILSGINYFLHRHTYLIEGVVVAGEHDGGNERDERNKDSPLTTALLLMTLNASIGVPIVLAYSALIYEALGLGASESSLLSTIYPLLQLMFLLVIAHSFSTTPTRTLIMGGYSLCLAFMIIAVLTQRLPTLGQQPVAKAVAASLWFTALAVGSSVPANAGVQAIGSLPFANRSQMIRTIAYSRAFFWLLSAIMSEGFLHLLKRRSLVQAFTPCAFTTAIVLIIIGRSNIH